VPTSREGSIVSRRIAAGIALVIGCAIPATAVAGFPGVLINDYEGNVQHDLSTSFGFDVDRINGSRAAHNFDLISIPYNCHDGSSQRVNILNTADTLPVIHRHFEGRLQHADTVLKIDGDLRSGGRARGHMSWNVNDGTEAGTCYSGLLSWSATR
jgi:hypothetical protein